MTGSQPLFRLSSILALLQLVAPAGAQTLTWDAKGNSLPDGVFGNAANWNPDQAPAAGNDLIFDLPETYTVTFDDAEASDKISVAAGTVDQSDYAYWKAHFGESIAGSGAAAQVAVPEPASGVVLLLGLSVVGLKIRLGVAPQPVTEVTGRTGPIP